MKGAGINRIRPVEPTKRSRVDPSQVAIGRDVLELVSSAMYVDPLTIYREYVQNAADAVDEARRAGLLEGDRPGRVDVRFDPAARSVAIRDDGVGICWEEFAPRLLAIGGSTKRGRSARGFRGVGRLAGLGYARELVFRSRCQGEKFVSELVWDCVALKRALRSDTGEDTLPDLVSSVVQVERTNGESFPDRFFEVELRGVVRLRSDRLMNSSLVADYLSQVAPVPFSPDFAWSDELAEAVAEATGGIPLDIFVDGSPARLTRPHRNELEMGGERTALIEDIDVFTVPDVDGEVAALVWLAHHPYEGAVPTSNLVKGLRMRVGDIQIGGSTILEDLFPESRFNGWTVGEVHVLDRRVVPNARRDDFEQNAHLANLLNQLTPTARDITRRCRENSIRRNLLRRFASALSVVQAAIDETAAFDATARSVAIAFRRGEDALTDMARIAGRRELGGEAERLSAELSRARARLEQARGRSEVGDDPLAFVPLEARELVEKVLMLVEGFMTDREQARAITSKVVAELKRDQTG